ncbi:MAG: hypothetical protein KR126chlam6_00215 [Candidatus Anoxychlamydiales bacterium]|nr:hypothetical protein [Candidatus Anoxychlamydiales bacterium]
MKLNENRIYDPIRQRNVLALPEEIVRQNLLLKMTKHLGYPKSLIAVEKDLNKLDHLKNKDITLKKRRADIICFGKDIEPNYPLYPLLMIECKADKLDQTTIDQVIGYNHLVEAYFLAIANRYEIITYWYNIKESCYNSVNFLPSYDELIQKVICKS